MARATMKITKNTKRTIYTKGQYEKHSNHVQCPVCGKYMAKKG